MQKQRKTKQAHRGRIREVKHTYTKIYNVTKRKYLILQNSFSGEIWLYLSSASITVFTHLQKDMYMISNGYKCLMTFQKERQTCSVL